MKKDRFSMALGLLSLALILAGISMYLNHKKNRASNEIKSQLTQDLTLKNTAEEKTISAESHSTPLSQTSTNETNPAAKDDLVSQERVYSEIELSQMTENQFSELLKDTQRRLPKLSDIKKIPEGALHHTPELVLEAGRNLGVIKEVLKTHENYEKLAVPFYVECAKNEEGSTPVRALCLTNLIEIHKKIKKPLNLKEFPSQVVELSRLVTDM
jgi:type III secretory pathway component EscV